MVNTKMQVIVDKKLADAFRQKVGEKYGAKKGSISEAFSEALKNWIYQK